MKSGEELRRKRIAAGLAAYLVAKKAGIRPSRLTYIERGLADPKPEEAVRIEQAIQELVQAREVLSRVARHVGWPTWV